MENAALQVGLLNLLHQARKAELAWMSTLSTDEHEASGTQEHWSAKNLLAHISSWKRRGAERLMATNVGEMPPQLNSLEQFNEETFTASQGRSWEEIQDEAEQAFTALVVQVERLPETVFAKQEDIVWQIMACGGKHPYRHLSEFFLQRGDMVQATRLYEELIEELHHMPLPPQELGRAMYQLACFYAVTEQLTKAFEELSHAMRLEPRVITWLEQDNTLDMLRAIPDFQTLFPISLRSKSKKAH